MYSQKLLVSLARCGVCGKAVSIVSSGHGSPRYGCPNSWHNGKDACDNRMTIMAKVADPVVLGGLQDALLQPSMLRTITKAVSAEVSKALSSTPSQQQALRTRRSGVEKKLTNLVQAIEEGIALPAVREQITKREAELRQIDDDLAALHRPAPVDLAVIPTWVRQQLEDLSGLLGDSPERAKAELHRLNIQFTVTPVRDEGRPFLRVEGTGDLEALCGIRNLPSPARSPLPRPLSIGGHSLPRVAR